MSSYKITSHIGLAPTHMTLFYLNYLFKGPAPNTVRFWLTGATGRETVRDAHRTAWEMSTVFPMDKTWQSITLIIMSADIHRRLVMCQALCPVWRYSSPSRPQAHYCCSHLQIRKLRFREVMHLAPNPLELILSHCVELARKSSHLETEVETVFTGFLTHCTQLKLPA